MEITGKIIAVLDKKSGVSKAGNAWESQEYVLEVPGQYPKKICFEVYGNDKIQQFNIQAGEDLTVSFDIDAREWNGRWFNSIRAWNVVRQPGQGTQVLQTQAPSNVAAQGNNDPLPF